MGAGPYNSPLGRLTGRGPGVRLRARATDYGPALQLGPQPQTYRGPVVASPPGVWEAAVRFLTPLRTRPTGPMGVPPYPLRARSTGNGPALQVRGRTSPPGVAHPQGVRGQTRFRRLLACVWPKGKPPYMYPP
eukprot:gene24723-biopygen8959